ncbi:MAG: (2Fe-2S)-binding protein [Sneathiellaceae bacterium]
MITLKVNGQQREVDVADDTPLLWVLRDELKITGPKFGCGIAQCGACTVHADGVPIRSCQTLAADATDMEIVTIDAVSGKEAKAIQAAWEEMAVPQCGYCQSGQMMSATALLRDTPKPSDADIDSAMWGNACRCATYHRIRAAIHRAAEIMEG